MHTSGYRLALLYDDTGYVETQRFVQQPRAGSPSGLMGRQVAGKEFLDAFIRCGAYEQLFALVYNDASARSLSNLLQTHPAAIARPRPCRLVPAQQFLQTFFPQAPAGVFYTPCPPDTGYAWARQHAGPGAYALCGVTHTLCSPGMVNLLGEMVTAPYEAFDALICTSRAVVDMVRAVTGTYADYLRERHGGTPGLRPHLELIPLGVDTDKFRPATPQERSAQRQALNIQNDEVAVLFVGRFAAHAKVHPVPILQALQMAAATVGRPVHLVMAGWGHESSIQHYAEAARTFAPAVRVTIVDGTDPKYRFPVWQAADLFTSLADNIQETFGLVVAEAMASGLPVVASDWDGYRDIVDDGVTGYLVPSYLVHGASADATARLLLNVTDYDVFLSEVNQTATLDVHAAAEGYARLIADAALRRRMGEAGRRRALERFAWPRIIRAYEDLWRRQDEERRAWLAHASGARKTYLGPARYPAPEETFAGYPSGVLEDGDKVAAVAGAEELLALLLQRPLTSYAAETRCRDVGVLKAVLEQTAQPRPLTELDGVFAGAGVAHAAGRATVAWMLKYALLRVVAEQA